MTDKEGQDRQIALGLIDPETGKIIAPPSVASADATAVAIAHVLDPNERHTTDEYQTAALRTESPISEAMARMTEDKLRLLHGLIGLATEVGELMDLLKRHLFYGAEFSIEGYVEELGDLQWYMALVCDVLKVQPSTVQKANIAKLLRRYPGQYSDAYALLRATDEEMATMRTYLMKCFNPPQSLTVSAEDLEFITQRNRDLSQPAPPAPLPASASRIVEEDSEL